MSPGRSSAPSRFYQPDHRQPKQRPRQDRRRPARRPGPEFRTWPMVRSSTSTLAVLGEAGAEVVLRSPSRSVRWPWPGIRLLDVSPMPAGPWIRFGGGPSGSAYLAGHPRDHRHRTGRSRSGHRRAGHCPRFWATRIVTCLRSPRLPTRHGQLYTSRSTGLIPPTPSMPW
jgi:hypothetical protein